MRAFRFWRLYATNSSDTGWEAYYRQLIWYSCNDQVVDWKCAWSGNDGNQESSGNVKLALDGNNNTMYRTCMNPGQHHDWVAFDNGEPISITRLIIKQYGAACNHITALDLEGSDDGTEWHLVGSIQNLPIDLFDSSTHAHLLSPTTLFTEESEATSATTSSSSASSATTSATATTATATPASATTATTSATPTTAIALATKSDRRTSKPYIPPRPPIIDRYPELNLDVLEIFDYQSNIGGSNHVTIWMGPRIALVICHNVKQEFDPDNVNAMALVVHNLERMLELFDVVVGRSPIIANGWEGRVRYEIAYINAGGLASHGVAGIATGPAFLSRMYDDALRGICSINHVFFYETTRNYIFPEVFTEVLDFHLSDGPDCWGWVNQGFINVTGCLFANDIPVEFYYYGQNREQFMRSMHDHLECYMKHPEYTWENTWNHSRLPWNSSMTVDNLFSGLVVHLFQKYGGLNFLCRWFRALPHLLHRKPKSKSDSQGARDNFFITASIAAMDNLVDLFVRKLRWNISEEAKEYVMLLKVADWGE
eukprot:c9527_g2_i1.p1 GENE.c9527_g2_i1~~c9527_g2_i1.p1  ORF type:complete len:539 (-),score=126.06 c9527_g2_i1:108-1724(-)